MLKYFTFLICIILSFFIGKYNSFNSEPVQKEEKTILKDTNIIKTELKTNSFPPFLEKELKKFDISLPLTQKKWDLLLQQIKQNLISKHNNHAKDALAFHAINANDINYLKYLINNDPNFNINQKNKRGHTLLMEAIKSSDFYIAKELIALGADFHATTNKGKDLLNFALENTFNRHQIELLLENGFSFDNSTKYFRELNLPHNKKLLLEYSKNIDFNKNVNIEMNLFDNMMNIQNDEYLVTKILEKNNIQAKDGYNALHIASQKDNYSIKLINKLIDRGFDVNSQSKSTQQTPLMFAVRNANLEKVNYLLSKGAKIDIKDWKDNNIYYYVDKIRDSSKKTKIINLIKKYSKE